MTEINPIPEGYHEVDVFGDVSWSDPRLKRITRFRMVSDPDFPKWDVSYCHGQLADGSFANVELPFTQLSKRSWRRDLVKHAKKDGVYAAGLGFFSHYRTLC